MLNIRCRGAPNYNPPPSVRLGLVWSCWTLWASNVSSSLSAENPSGQKGERKNPLKDHFTIGPHHLTRSTWLNDTWSCCIEFMTSLYISCHRVRVIGCHMFCHYDLISSYDIHKIQNLVENRTLSIKQLLTLKFQFSWVNKNQNNNKKTVDVHLKLICIQMKVL